MRYLAHLLTLICICASCTLHPEDTDSASIRRNPSTSRSRPPSCLNQCMRRSCKDITLKNIWNPPNNLDSISLRTTVKIYGFTSFTCDGIINTNEITFTVDATSSLTYEGTVTISAFFKNHNTISAASKIVENQFTCTHEEPCIRPAANKLELRPCQGNNGLCRDAQRECGPFEICPECGPCTPPVNGSVQCNNGQCSIQCNEGALLCGTSCCTTTVDNATPTCSGGACGGWSCNTGYTKCGNACYNDTQSNADHCGVNCTKCPAGPANSTPSCVSGSCDWKCKAGYTKCGNACFEINSDLNNCGACGNVCQQWPGHPVYSAVCSNGICGYKCNSPYTMCPTGCKKLESDEKNCGVCGNACKPLEVCQNGKCASCIQICTGAGQSCGSYQECDCGKCSINQVCEGGRCISTICTPPCPPDQMCRDARCVPRPTSKCNPPCQPPEVCGPAGRCSKPCDPPCVPPKSCVRGICVLTICDPVCPHPQECVLGVCVHPRPCNPPCTPPAVCIRGQCRIIPHPGPE